MHTQFSEQDITRLSAPMKVGLLGTVTPEGLPHITLISTLMASSASQLAFGQFMEGRSKQHLLHQPKVGWLVMTLDKNVWRGSATFTHISRSGPEYDRYNNQPLFRYNAYFGVHTVYYLNLVSHAGMAPLPMNRIIFAALQTMWARSLRSGNRDQPVMNPWTVGFLNKLTNLKFIGYIDSSGYPVILPAIQAQAAGQSKVYFSAAVFGAELASIPAGSPMAVFGMSLDMEDVLLRGEFKGLEGRAGVRCGVVEIDWVYNPMPPVPGQIYPPLPLEAVEEF